jgi:hypothetical protein
MQKIHSIINCLRFARPFRRGPVGGEAGKTLGADAAVCPCDQTTGEGQS